MSEVTLPSGAKLKVQEAPFVDSKALYQALLEEAAGLKLDPNQDIDVNFFKDVFCVGFSSKKIEACIWKCMERVTYDGQRVTMDSFEPVKAREDYMTVLFEVVQENIRPFAKNLYAQFSRITGMMQNVPA